MLNQIRAVLENALGYNEVPGATQPVGKETQNPTVSSGEPVETVIGGEENVGSTWPSPMAIFTQPEPPKPAPVVTPPTPAPVAPAPVAPVVKPPVAAPAKPAFVHKKTEVMPDGSVAITFDYNVKPEKPIPAQKNQAVAGKKR